MLLALCPGFRGTFQQMGRLPVSQRKADFLNGMPGDKQLGSVHRVLSAKLRSSPPSNLVM